MSKQILDLTDDLVIFYRGDSMPVAVGPELRRTGWPGGQWVMFVPPTGIDEFLVEASDGSNVCGCLLFPSENYTPGEMEGAQNNYTGQPHRTELGASSGASTVSILMGSNRLLFKRFETEALDADGDRVAGPITYELNKPLYISENGLLCNDDTDNLQAAGVATPQVVGICSAVPAARNNNRLGLDTRI